MRCRHDADAWSTPQPQVYGDWWCATTHLAQSGHQARKEEGQLRAQQSYKHAHTSHHRVCSRNRTQGSPTTQPRTDSLHTRAPHMATMRTFANENIPQLARIVVKHHATPRHRFCRFAVAAGAHGCTTVPPLRRHRGGVHTLCPISASVSARASAGASTRVRRHGSTWNGRGGACVGCAKTSSYPRGGTA